MKIGLLIAMEEELTAFLQSRGEIREERIHGRKVYKTYNGADEIIAMTSGYGVIDAAATTQLLITGYGCERILNFGVTGALIPELRVDDLFLVEKVCHYDFDVSPIEPLRPGQYAEFQDQFMPLDPDLIARAREADPALRLTTAASGDKFVEDREVKKQLAAMGCQICDMEIAAITRVCFLNGVPCLSIKCISDTFEGDGGDFRANLDRSSKKAFQALEKLL